MFGRWTSRTVAAVSLALSCLGAPAEGSTPPPNSQPRHLFACDPYSSVSNVSNACMAGALADFNAARAREGLGPMRLPTNFRRLNIPQQMFVLTNIDRVDRGLWPIRGLSSRLNAVGVRSANVGGDVLPCRNCWASSNWSQSVNAFWTEFLWMYDDGPGGVNVGADWGHRRNILETNFPGPVYMGVGIGSNGTGEVFQGADTQDTADALSWAYESAYFSPPLVPSLSVSAGAQAVTVQLTGHSHSVVKLQSWNGRGWVTVGFYQTPGTALPKATWSKRVARPQGYYRAIVAANTRYASTTSGVATVR